MRGEALVAALPDAEVGSPTGQTHTGAPTTASVRVWSTFGSTRRNRPRGRGTGHERHRRGETAARAVSRPPPVATGRAPFGHGPDQHPSSGAGRGSACVHAIAHRAVPGHAHPSWPMIAPSQAAGVLDHWSCNRYTANWSTPSYEGKHTSSTTQWPPRHSGTGLASWPEARGIAHCINFLAPAALPISPAGRRRSAGLHGRRRACQG